MFKSLKLSLIDSINILVLLILASVISSYIFQHHTGLYGDATIYLNAAKSISENKGIFVFQPLWDTNYLYSPLTGFAPLYPIVCGLLMKLSSADRIVIARMVSVISYILTTIPIYFIVKNIFRSRLIAFISVLLFLTNRQVIEISTYIQTESLYYLLIFLTILAYQFYLTGHFKRRHVLLVSVLSALTFATRYVGVGLIILSALFLFLSMLKAKCQFRQILINFVIWLLATLAIVLPIVFRNLYYSGRLFGMARGKAEYGFAHYLVNGAQYLVDNFYTSSFNVHAEWAIVLMALALFLIPPIVIFIQRKKLSKTVGNLYSFWFIWLISILTILYISYAFSIQFVTDYELRFIPIVYVYLSLMLPGSFYMIIRSISHKKLVSVVCILLSLLLLAKIFNRQKMLLQDYSTKYLTSTEEQLSQTQTLKWAKDNIPKDEIIVTNDDHAIILFADHKANRIYLTKFDAVIENQPQIRNIYWEKYCSHYIVIFTHPDRFNHENRLSKAQIIETINQKANGIITLEKYYSDGVVLKINKPQEWKNFQCGSALNEYGKPKFDGYGL